MLRIAVLAALAASADAFSAPLAARSHLDQTIAAQRGRGATLAWCGVHAARGGAQQEWIGAMHALAQRDVQRAICSVVLSCCTAPHAGSSLSACSAGRRRPAVAVTMQTRDKPKVAVVGAGWGGWAAAKALCENGCDVTCERPRAPCFVHTFAHTFFLSALSKRNVDG